MSQTFTVQMPAGKGQVFAADAFDDQIGQAIPVWDGQRHVTGVVLAVEVAEDGASMQVTMETSDVVLPPALPDGWSYSVPPGPA